MSTENKRTTFLQVLCVLTFIGSVASSIWLFAAEGSEEFSTWFQIVILALNVGTALAAMMMWNLKQLGFYLYAFFELTAVIIPFVMAMADRPAIQAFFAITFISVLAILSILMVILYWLAIKDWNKR